MSTATPSLHAANGLREGVNPYLIAVVVGLAAFMEVLDISIANVSLRNIAGSLSAGQEESTWVLTSYLVANAISLPMSGWFSMLLGRKRFYIISILLFTFSSLCCGLAPSLPWLIVFRVLQGLGGGALQPVSQSILSDAFPPEKRAAAFGIYGVAVVAAPAIGPTLGGWITDSFSWHWIFLINVPVGLGLTLASRFLLSDPLEFTQAREARFREGFKVDYLGFGLIALGLGTLQLVLDKGQIEDWLDSALIRYLLLISVVSLVAAVIWEWRHSHPVVNLHLLKDRNFSTGLFLMLILGIALMGTTVLLPMLMQSVLGYTASRAGLVMSPGGLMSMFLMPVGAMLVTRIDPRKVIAFGLTILTGSMLHMASFSVDVDEPTMMLARIFQTAGIAFLFLPLNTAAFVNVPTAESGNASALINLSRNIGGSIGISLLTTSLSRSAQLHQTHLVDRVSDLDPVYQTQLPELLGRFHGNLEAAQAWMYGAVHQQSMMLAFVDDFHALAIGLMCCAPMILLLRRPRPGAGMAIGH